MNKPITMTMEHLAATLATARLRERNRCIKIVETRRDIALGDGEAHHAAILDILAESMREGAGSSRVALVESEPAAAEALIDDPGPPDGGLPPVHHLDDIDEGTALARRFGAFGGVRD